MDVWEQKLQLAEQITGFQFNDDQSDMFSEDSRDIGIFFFYPGNGMTTAGAAHAIINAYWEPNSKHLYIANDKNAALDIAKDLATKISKHRPERKYQIHENTLSIEFGETKSEVVFGSFGSYYIGEDYDSVMIDTEYNTLRLKHIIALVNATHASGKLVIMAQTDGAPTQIKTPSNSKLDAILKDIVSNE